MLSSVSVSDSTKPTRHVHFTEDAPSPSPQCPIPKLNIQSNKTYKNTLAVHILFHILAVVTAIAALKILQLAVQHSENDP
ncbi:hypothetical protein PTMSG1_01437 [Pyrenophora teres f. maculata]|nr:hypothetical protein PTMSG1_01437 [Pyrenophora teres f. maculata]